MGLEEKGVREVPPKGRLAMPAGQEKASEREESLGRVQILVSEVQHSPYFLPLLKFFALGRFYVLGSRLENCSLLTCVQISF